VLDCARTLRFRPSILSTVGSSPIWASSLKTLSFLIELCRTRPVSVACPVPTVFFPPFLFRAFFFKWTLTPPHLVAIFYLCVAFWRC